MLKNNTKGILISFCGLDGCGKTTIINKVSKELERTGKEIILTKQPTDWVRTSNIFRNYIDEPDHKNFEYRSLSLLAASDRLQHVNKLIVPALEDGAIVITDRYFYSCLANLWARGYEHDKWIFEIAKFIVEPDIAFFLDVPVSTAVNRVWKRPEEADRFVDLALQYSLRSNYMKIARQNNGIILSTEEDENKTYCKVMKFINNVLERKNG